MEKTIKLLSGEKIYLRPLEYDDVDFLFALFNDPTVRYFTGTTEIIVRKQIENFIEKSANINSRVDLIICDQENNLPIGDINLISIDRNNRSAEVGIKIGDNQYQGKGYGTEAMKLLLDYCFSALNLHRISLTVYEYNPRAIRSYEKVGF
ncbi:MAG TPA: GNAT family N-acetyltransferase, partial [Pseudoneobacillus sp.]|nr:GNAT family N-acetyltransferase [Pseudoneobacillus sp.]